MNHGVKKMKVFCLILLVTYVGISAATWTAITDPKKCQICENIALPDWNWCYTCAHNEIDKKKCDECENEAQPGLNLCSNCSCCEKPRKCENVNCENYLETGYILQFCNKCVDLKLEQELEQNQYYEDQNQYYEKETEYSDEEIEYPVFER
ncbi:uncharacterized protein LOC126893838 [Daktulosphaira vitifoliae]|uniref:uncharacterized protein LOC126893838 n=1 Tax=Daktulosphaira vitifoliae TaxID=58002 RepID=UPI0021AAA87A|nr:uncharacterized protein LOC126893838 [Daktulosphaira vitifoliae]